MMVMSGDEERPEGFEELEARLLAIGGAEVDADDPDAYLAELLECGRVFTNEGVWPGRGPGEYAHQLAAVEYAFCHSTENGRRLELVTGYGLTTPGYWVQHSWLWDGEKVIETNYPFRAYYGVVLSEAGSARFVFDHVVRLLPGIGDVEDETVPSVRPRTDAKPSRSRSGRAGHTCLPWGCHR